MPRPARKLLDTRLLTFRIYHDGSRKAVGFQWATFEEPCQHQSQHHVRMCRSIPLMGLSRQTEQSWIQAMRRADARLLYPSGNRSSCLNWREASAMAAKALLLSARLAMQSKKNRKYRGIYCWGDWCYVSCYSVCCRVNGCGTLFKITRAPNWG